MTNSIKTKIDNTQKNSTCRLCKERYETNISEWRTRLGMTEWEI